MCVSDRNTCHRRPDRSAQILKDEKKRAAFDQYGAASQHPALACYRFWTSCLVFMHFLAIVNARHPRIPGEMSPMALT